MKKRKEALQGATDFHYENFLRRSRYTSVFLVLLAAFCVITVLNINTGNVDISIPKILKIIFLREGNKMEYNIIWKIRLPRILMAAILGGALSLSGFLLQTFFENPIAGPFVLGISSGAKMVVALAMIYFLGRFQVVSSYTLIIAAFIGSLIATGFILLVSRRINHMATLLVAGIMIGYICSAVTDFVVTFAEDSDIVNLHGWSHFPEEGGSEGAGDLSANGAGGVKQPCFSAIDCVFVAGGFPIAPLTPSDIVAQCGRKCKRRRKIREKTAKKFKNQ